MIRAASSSRTASRPGSQRVTMGLGVGPSGAFLPSWPLRAETARGPNRSLMQPWRMILPGAPRTLPQKLPPRTVLATSNQELGVWTTALPVDYAGLEMHAAEPWTN